MEQALVTRQRLPLAGARQRIQHGGAEPDQVMKRPQSGPDLPWEAWKYARTRGLKFVFMDLTRFGNYALIYTNDRRETIRPDWESLLGTEAVTDVERF